MLYGDDRLLPERQCGAAVGSRDIRGYGRYLQAEVCTQEAQAEVLGSRTEDKMRISARVQASSLELVFSFKCLLLHKRAKIVKNFIPLQPA